MCGIAGIINFNGASVKESSIKALVHKMKHRGPDDDGLFLEDNMALGFVRLSIIDLTSAGHQPKFSEDERYVIVFNGEIFNYLELKTELEQKGVQFHTKTDTEVLLNSYIYWGEECLVHFNGMWAFSIYDRKEKILFAARDRFGIKPFYYSLTPHYFAFCSEIPPLLTLLENKPKANEQIIYDFLTFNRNDHSEYTFFEEVKKMQHGTKLLVKNNKVSFSKWYDLKTNVSKKEGFKDATEYKNLLTSSVNLQMRSDVPVGVCLSGGLDSSTILSIILKNNFQNNTSSFSAVFGKGKIGDESEFIDEYASLVNNMYKVTPTAASLEKDLFDFIDCQAEPIPSTSAYSEYKIMEMQHGKVGVTLTGQGADEGLAGYDYFYGFYFKYLFQHLKLLTLFRELFYYFRKHKSLFGFKTFFYFLLPKNIRVKVKTSKNTFINTAFSNKYKNNGSPAGNVYNAIDFDSFFIEHFEHKLEHHLIWSDRSSMHFSIEARVPFLDHRLIEKTLATKKELIIHNGISKYILRESMKGILPEKIRIRKDKVGFETPEANWFREPTWQKIILDIIHSTTFKQRGLIDHKEAQVKYNEHLTGKIDISREIWKWVHLELWFRRFID